MKHQPKQGTKTNDDVQTPPVLCRRLICHFDPQGKVMEPCRGAGNFYNDLVQWSSVTEVTYCEIKEGRDFFDYAGPRVDWIITNPPFSKARKFALRAFEVADNVVFLITLNHALGLKARWRDVTEQGFGVRQFVLLDTPAKETGWPPAGFQLGAVHWQRGYCGPIEVHDWRVPKEQL
jgi:hypothetical protein